MGRLVAVGIFSILYLMNKDQVFFQCEEDSEISDAQAVFAGLACQPLNITLHAMLESVEPQTNSAPLFLWQDTQLRQGGVTDVQPVIHKIHLRSETSSDKPARCELRSCY
jgi:hypothetical protein